MKRAICVWLAVVVLFVSGTVGDASASADSGRGFASAGGSTHQTSRAPSLRKSLKGIDVSNYNGSIDFAKVKAAGIKFVIAKATQGLGYEDPTYPANSSGAKTAGLRFGAYEFADPGPGASDPIAAADHFLTYAALQPDNLVPVLDLERTGGLGRANLISWVSRWCHRIKTQLGVEPAIYTSASFWQSSMGNTRTLAKRGDPLWIANWFVKSPSVPASNWSGRGWSVWQWSDRGHVSGTTGRTDLDVANARSLRSLTIKNV